jgi:translation initiation factor 2 beta subunit (eIF-2beta)/eIF-5
MTLTKEYADALRTWDCKRPCPWCGSYEVDMHDYEEHWFVVCRTCGASGPSVEINEDIDDDIAQVLDVKERASRKWDAR